jgi:hypothetical protein
MIRNSIELGIMFHIIDANRAEKADLVPLSGTLAYRPAFEKRVHQLVLIPGAEPFEVWCARPEDVIFGKLMAWKEGRSRKYESDIFEIMRHHYLESKAENAELNEAAVDHWAERLGKKTNDFWKDIKSNAKKEADEIR